MIKFTLYFGLLFYIFFGYDNCFAERIRYNVPLSQADGENRLWFSLSDAPVSFRGDIAKFPQSGKVESAEISFFFRYEPDWTDVELEFNVKTLAGDTIYNERWNGARHVNPTKWNIRYAIQVPTDVVQRWLTHREQVGFTFFRKYIAGGRNSRHPLVFGGADGTDETRLMLTFNIELDENLPPTAPQITSVVPTLPVSGKILLHWRHDSPRDYNSLDILTYQVQVSVGGGQWISPAGLSAIGDSVRSAMIMVPEAPLGTPFKLRVRAVDQHGAAGGWAELSEQFVVGPLSKGVLAFLDYPLKKVMRFEKPIEPVSPPVFIAAQGESESIQFVVSDSSAHEGLEIRLSPFISASGEQIPEERVIVFRQEYINITKPSTGVGSVGWWPDALVPLKDPYYGERRMLRPMVLNASENESFWIDVNVPPSQKSGLYTSSLELVLGSEIIKTVSLSLEVLPFAIPVQPTLRTAFGFDPSSLSTVSFQDCKIEATKHRISFYGGYFTIVGDYDDLTGVCKINTSQTERFFEDVMSGKGMPDNRMFTSVNITGGPNKDTDEAWIAYWRAVEQFLDNKRWLEKAYVYIWDEPADRHLNDVAKKSELVKKGAPRLKTLVTTGCRPVLQELVDIWCPVINFYDKEDKYGGEALYRSRQQLGEEVWWYTSMMSQETVRLPNYFIDASIISPRVVGWLSWLRGIEGVLYYHMAYSWKNDPWDSQYAFGANGDGTLWYPGNPANIGGTKSIPIPSIRLKAIRDGLEDYEYLVLLEKLVGVDKAREICKTVARTEYNWSSDPLDMATARENLARAIVNHLQ